MPLELTDEDRAAIRKALAETFPEMDQDDAITSYDEAMYGAGLRAGIERAAKVAEQHFIYGHSVAGPHFAAAGAAAIRALLTEGKRDG